MNIHQTAESNKEENVGSQHYWKNCYKLYILHTYSVIGKLRRS